MDKNEGFVSSQYFYINMEVLNIAAHLAVIKALQKGNRIKVLCRMVFPGEELCVQDGCGTARLTLIFDNLPADLDVTFLVQNGSPHPRYEGNVKYEHLERDEVPSYCHDWDEIPFRTEKSPYPSEIMCGGISGNAEHGLSEQAENTAGVLQATDKKNQCADDNQYFQKYIHYKLITYCMVTGAVALITGILMGLSFSH